METTDKRTKLKVLDKILIFGSLTAILITLSWVTVKKDDVFGGLTAMITVCSFFGFIYSLKLTREQIRKSDEQHQIDVRIAAMTAQLSVIPVVLEQKHKHIIIDHDRNFTPNAMTEERIIAWIESYEKEPDKKCLTDDFKKILYFRQLQENIVKELEKLSNQKR